MPSMTQPRSQGFSLLPDRPQEEGKSPGNEVERLSMTVITRATWERWEPNFGQKNTNNMVGHKTLIIYVREIDKTSKYKFNTPVYLSNFY